MAVRSMGRGELPKKRMKVAFWLVLGCYGGLMGRLFYLQGIHGETIRKEASDRRTREIPLPARRGSLSDREGRLLAVSRYSGTVSFDPNLLLPDPKNPKQTAKMERELEQSYARVAAILNIPEDSLRKTVREARLRNAEWIQKNPDKPPLKFFKIKSDVSQEEATLIKESSPRLTGFGVVDGTKRVYPGGADAVHAIGFLDQKGKGAAGLEKSIEDQLHGTPGKAKAEVDRSERQIPDSLIRLEPARDGLDITTTLDATVQHIATEEAQKVLDKFHPDGISVIVIDPETGDILALVSLPNFDPNPGQHGTIPEGGYIERCTASLYEPGSTLKTLTLAIGLETGVIKRNSGFQCNGVLQVGRKTLRCDAHGGSNVHGWETLTDIMRHSCNVGAAQVGLRLGAQRLYEGLEKFNIPGPLEVGLPYERKGYLNYSNIENINNPSKVGRVSFGQAITTTPLHIAMAYSAIANDGILMKPRLMLRAKNAKGQTKQVWEPGEKRRVLSSQTCADVCAMLREVVTNGTGKVVAIPGYTVAGKTGTANKYRKNAYIGSFVGFLPASSRVKPRATILVAVDEPRGAYYGADVAAPAFREIARRLMAVWHVPEDDPDSVQYKTAVENARRTGTILPAVDHAE